MSQTIAQPLAPPVTPSYRLYSPGAAGLATFLGTTVAGGVVMGLNYWRWGERGKAFLSMILGVVTLLAVAGTVLFLPDTIPAAVYIVPQIVGVHFLCKILQEKRINAHKQEGGGIASNWKAAGIGLLIGLLLAGAFFAYWFSMGAGMGALLDTQHSVDMGHGQEVFYSRGATKADAERLGAALKEKGFFGGDHGATVLLRGSGTSKEICFVVNEGAWNKPEIIAVMHAIVEQVADSVGGKPVTLILMDDKMAEQKRVKVE